MTYGDSEQSLEDGKPIRLYRFTLGSNVWRYTSADEDLTFGSEVWRAIAISDDGIKQTGESNSDALMIRCPIDAGPAAVFAHSPPGSSLGVQILVSHEGLTTPRVVYDGEVLQVGYPSPGLANVTCQTLSATMQRMGLRMSWMRTCPFVVYDPLTCKVSKASQETVVTISSDEGFSVKGAGFASRDNGYFTAGFIEWTHPVRGVQRLMMESHTGDTVMIFGDTIDLYPGLVVKAYRGCNQTAERCDTAFGNLPNYGGCDFMPGRSPYDGIANPFF